LAEIAVVLTAKKTEEWALEQVIDYAKFTLFVQRRFEKISYYSGFINFSGFLRRQIPALYEPL